LFIVLLLVTFVIAAITSFVIVLLFRKSINGILHRTVVDRTG